MTYTRARRRRLLPPEAAPPVDITGLHLDDDSKCTGGAGTARLPVIAFSVADLRKGEDLSAR